MKKRMALCLLSLAGMISTEIANAQLYEYKQLDGTSAKPQPATGRGGTTQPPAITGSTDLQKTNSTTSMPFDGGLTLVLAAGAGLALKKKYGKKTVARPSTDK